jgi:hypothetical protein
VSALVFLGASGCTRGPSATPPDERAAQRDRVASRASAEPHAAPALSVPELAPVLEGCLVDVDFDAGTAAALEQASALCLAGMERMVTRERDGGIEFRIDDPARCVRVAAAGARGVRAIDVAIVDAGGRRLENAQARAPFAWVPARGPLCVASAGTYRAQARVTEGAGPLALAAWQAKGD